MSDFDLLEHAQLHARECLEGLEDPDDDVMPVMLWLGPYGMGIMPMLDMSDQEAKDRLVGKMVTALAVGRATEVVTITTSWMVSVETTPELRKGILDVMPSEHPDRVENVVITHVDEESDGMTSAVITRFSDKPPTLGDWTCMDFGREPVRMGGRFGDAMHLGLDLVKSMPPELVEIIDDGWALGRQDELITRFHNVYSQFAKAAQ